MQSTKHFETILLRCIQFAQTGNSAKEGQRAAQCARVSASSTEEDHSESQREHGRAK